MTNLAALRRRLYQACGMAPIQRVRRELDALLGDAPDRPETALDARTWLAELAWADGEHPGLAEAVADSLEVE